MPRHTYDDLLRALARGEVAPVYYLYGPEEILKAEATRAIVERALQPHERDFNLDQRQAASLDPEALNSLVNTLPMMAARRCVVVREIEAWHRKTGPREVLRAYLENPSAETVLVLSEGAPPEGRQREWAPDAEVASRSYAVDFQPLQPERVPKWLAHHARRLEVRLADGAAEHLAAATGYDLGTIRSELEKLAGLAETEPISAERVGELVGVRHGETLEDWVDAVLDDRTDQALRLGPRVLEQAGMSGVKMVTALGTALIGLSLARAHHDAGQRGGALERTLWERLRALRPFGLGDWKAVVRRWSGVVAAWPAPRLRGAIRAALEADMALKSTRFSSDEDALTDLVLRLTPAPATTRVPAS
jgi:DNA polymerase III subunit delta